MASSNAFRIWTKKSCHCSGNSENSRLITVGAVITRGLHLPWLTRGTENHVMRPSSASPETQQQQQQTSRNQVNTKAAPRRRLRTCPSRSNLWWLVELPKRLICGYAGMYDPTFMDFLALLGTTYKCLSAERSSRLNIENWTKDEVCFRWHYKK